MPRKTGSSKLTTPQVISMYEQAERLGGWKKRGTITKIAEMFDVSRGTVYKMLRETGGKKPQRESRLTQRKSKFVDQFSESAGWHELKRIYPNLAKKTLKEAARIGLIGARILGSRDKLKDPISWTKQDFMKLWSHPDFKNEDGSMNYYKAIDLRRWMAATGKGHLIPPRGVKSPDFPMPSKPQGGTKTTWYLSEMDVIDIINVIKEPDTLFFFLLGVEGGYRISGALTIKAEDIDYSQYTVTVFESKVKRFGKGRVTKYYLPCTMELLNRYTTDFKLKGKTRIFPYSDSTYYERLVRAGREAGVQHNVSTHILKHTFVTQGSRHGLSLETVVKQTGTDAKTLMDFYSGIGEEKQQHEILGKKVTEETWIQWVNKLNLYWRKRYEEIKVNFPVYDGVKQPLRKETVKEVKKAPLPFAAFKGTIKKWNNLSKAEKKLEKNLKWGRTVPKLKKIIALHEQGLNSNQIRKKLDIKSKKRKRK